MDNSENKLALQIEVNRILQILSNDIYDSPYALLRENIQNAYDAILMRQAVQNPSTFSPKIDVKIQADRIEISDNGIGMNREIVANNFWKAGSSGKNNETAKKAGVVGTFGIGAMANFGICSQLEVVTHYFQGDKTIKTFGLRDQLSVTERCIDIEEFSENREPGTTVRAILDSNVKLNIQSAIQYLTPYIQFIPIPIHINQSLVSQENYQEVIIPAPEKIHKATSLNCSVDNIQFTLKILLRKDSNVSVHCSDIKVAGEKIKGEIVLGQNEKTIKNIFGLRNYFGLAPIPIGNFFNFGGIINLPFLHPTAGREALSRESIQEVQKIINYIELKAAMFISKFSLADENISFQNYINSRNRFDLAGNIKIELKPGNERIILSDITPTYKSKSIYFYGGDKQEIINAYSHEESFLLKLSQRNPRRRIQHTFLVKKGIKEVPDKPQIIKVIDEDDLSIQETSLILRITKTLNEDYFLNNAEVQFAQISHGVPHVITSTKDKIIISLSRTSSLVQNLIQAYETVWEIFDELVKDFVRTTLYPKFSDYVPSSTRLGADTLYKLLLKNKELYEYEYSDFGRIEELLTKYQLGEVGFSDVLKQSSSMARRHSQSVKQNQVGQVEQELPSINETNGNPNTDIFNPFPPILRREVNTSKKIIRTDKTYPKLNNYKLFLCLSKSVYKRQLEFFLQPHTTKVIWGMHKILYIFSHASYRLSIYYDIELKERIDNNSTGGIAIPTTTLITSDRIFIPIIDPIASFFEIEGGSKEFFVRHDVIPDFSNSES